MFKFCSVTFYSVKNHVLTFQFCTFQFKNLFQLTGHVFVNAIIVK